MLFVKSWGINRLESAKSRGINRLKSAKSRGGNWTESVEKLFTLLGDGLVAQANRNSEALPGDMDSKLASGYAVVN